MVELPSDGVVIHRHVKVKARANEVKCNGIISGEPCGAIVFWVTLLSDSIKIQCITCYTEQKLRGPGIKKAIALLKANEKTKLLPVGSSKPKLLKRAKNTIDAIGHHVTESVQQFFSPETKGDENVNRDITTDNIGNEKRNKETGTDKEN